MSKSNLFDQPGIERLIPGKELPVGVKVTGRNMHAVTLLVSAAGEATGKRTVVGSYFDADGSLDHVKITYPGEDGNPVDQDVAAGDYLVLSEDRNTLLVADKSNYEFGKVFLPLLESLDKAAGSFVDSLLGK